MEILIKAAVGGQYTPGDIITIQPGGWTWSANEHLARWVVAHGSETGWPGNHFVAKVPELDFDGPVAAALLEPQYGPNDPITLEPSIVAPRVWAVDLESMEGSPLYALARDTGEATLTAAEALSFVVNKATGEPYPWP